MIARIVIELEHVKDVHVHVHEFVTRLYFHAFVLVVLLSVNNYLLVEFVTKIEAMRIFIWK